MKSLVVVLVGLFALTNTVFAGVIVKIQGSDYSANLVSTDGSTPSDLILSTKEDRFDLEASIVQRSGYSISELKEKIVQYRSQTGANLTLTIVKEAPFYDSISGLIVDFE